jgi:hypothetical protein
VSTKDNTISLLTDQQVELINRAIDGDLVAQEQQQLRRLLEDSTSAREFYQQLNQLDQRLSTANNIEPPEWLESVLMAKLNLPTSGVDATDFVSRPAWQQGLLQWARVWTPKSGLIWAAVLLAVGGVYQFSTDGIPVNGSTALVGTIVKSLPSKVITLKDQEPVHLPFINGQLIPHIEGDSVRLEISTAAIADSELRLDLDRDLVNQGDVEWLYVDKAHVVPNGVGQLRLSTETELKTEVEVHVNDGRLSLQSVPIHLAIYRAGALINELDLQIEKNMGVEKKNK